MGELDDARTMDERTFGNADKADNKTKNYNAATHRLHMPIESKKISQRVTDLPEMRVRTELLQMRPRVRNRCFKSLWIWSCVASIRGCLVCFAYVS